MLYKCFKSVHLNLLINEIDDRVSTKLFNRKFNIYKKNSLPNSNVLRLDILNKAMYTF